MRALTLYFAGVSPAAIAGMILLDVLVLVIAVWALTPRRRKRRPLVEIGTRSNNQ